jgi:hypothetical protein
MTLSKSSHFSSKYNKIRVTVVHMHITPQSFSSMSSILLLLAREHRYKMSATTSTVYKHVKDIKRAPGWNP